MAKPQTILQMQFSHAQSEYANAVRTFNARYPLDEEVIVEVERIYAMKQYLKALQQALNIQQKRENT